MLVDWHLQSCSYASVDQWKLNLSRARFLLHTIFFDRGASLLRLLHTIFFRQGYFTSSKSWMAHSQRASHMHPCTTGASPAHSQTRCVWQGSLARRAQASLRSSFHVACARAEKAHGMAIHYVWLGEKVRVERFHLRSHAHHELPWMRVLLVLEYEVGHVEWLTKSGKIKIHQVRKN